MIPPGTCTWRSGRVRTTPWTRSTPAAIAAGYRDNGAPGEWPAYHPGHYSAYVLDPDGNDVELVNHLC